MTAKSTPSGSTKYKMERNGDIVRGRFDSHGRITNEEVVRNIDPSDHAKFRAIVNEYAQSKTSSPERVRIGIKSRRTSRRRSRMSPKSVSYSKDARERTRLLHKYDSPLQQSYVPPDYRIMYVYGGRLN